MSGSMEERLKRRKLDALKRGVHRVGGDKSIPLTTHVVGIGKAGANAICQIIRDLEPDAPKFTALAIDIGDQDLVELRALAAKTPAGRAEVTTVALRVPDPENLFDALKRYGTFLQLEYPNRRWPNTGQPWFPRAAMETGPHFERAVAKAIYGYDYYTGQRTLETALRSFATNIDTERSQAVVAIIFGMSGGTGSGIAVDLARHLSNGLFGRRVLVAGLGIVPCGGDPQAHTGARLFTVMSELDILGDENKNRGVVMSCGDLFRNPFTAGFIMIPQQHIWLATQDLTATNKRVDKEIAALLTARRGTNLLELLRLLNWVAAPSTQHSAARTPWGPQWIHMLAFADAVDPELRHNVGLLPSYRPEFIEIRVGDLDGEATDLASGIQSAFTPEVPPQVVDGGRGAAQFILPRISKTDLSLFHQSLAAYEAEDENQRLLHHALLLDQGIMLCEPSTQIEGMAGASLGGGNGWIAVPLSDIRGQPAANEDAGQCAGAESEFAST